MKRSAAILGPTRPLLRWAIGYPCAYRDLEQSKVPDSTFKQLRVLRAASVAKIEGRICREIVLHPDANQVPPEAAKGFPLNEAVDVHGGSDSVEATCGPCPANVSLVQLADAKDGGVEVQPNGSWAGCFGWLAFGRASKSGDSKSDFNRLMRPELTGGSRGPGNAIANEVVADDEIDEANIDWIERFEAAIDRINARQTLSGLLRHKFAFNPAWYGVWSRRKLETDLLSVVDAIFQELEVPLGCVDVWRLKSAVRCCQSNSLPLHVELVPGGFSDGIHWSLEPQCQVCGVSRPDFKQADPQSAKSSRVPCPVCQSEVLPIVARKNKVLGLRPYLDLAKVIGVEATKEVVGQWSGLANDN